MDKVEIWEILVSLVGNEISLKEAHNLLCDTQLTDAEIIDFAKWFRREDTECNAEKYCNFSDMDMLDLFKDFKLKK